MIHLVIKESKVEKRNCKEGQLPQFFLCYFNSCFFHAKEEKYNLLLIAIHLILAANLLCGALKCNFLICFCIVCCSKETIFPCPSR